MCYPGYIFFVDFPLFLVELLLREPDFGGETNKIKSKAPKNSSSPKLLSFRENGFEYLQRSVKIGRPPRGGWDVTEVFSVLSVRARFPSDTKGSKVFWKGCFAVVSDVPGSRFPTS